MYGTNLTHFALTSNVKLFLAGLRQVEQRGAPEATIMLLGGDVGLGKSGTAQWHAVQKGLPYIRLKPKTSTGWVLSDLCVALGLLPPRASQDRFALVCARLVKMGKGLIADEIENGLADNGAAIDTLRAIGDETELPIILVGRGHVTQNVGRIAPVASRISANVTYLPLQPDDFALLARGYGLKLAEKEAAEITRRTGGSLRLGMNLLRNLVEAARRASTDTVTLKMLEAV